MREGGAEGGVKQEVDDESTDMRAQGIRAARETKEWKAGQG